MKVPNVLQEVEDLNAGLKDTGQSSGRRVRSKVPINQQGNKNCTQR